MAGADVIKPSGEKMKRTICWISETVQAYPERGRNEIIREAEMRFDLSPAESAFLEKNFTEVVEKGE